MSLEDAVRDYLSYIVVEQGLTKETHRTYQSWLNRFVGWLKENGYPLPSLAELNTTVLRRYLYSLHSIKLRPRTIWGAFHPIRGMGEYLIRMEAITTNPCEGVTLPQKDAAIRLTMTDDECLALLGACSRIHRQRRAALARGVVSMLMFSGLRRAECLALKVEDVDTNEGSVFVRSGKGQKSRKVFVPAECTEALSEWLAQRPKARHDFLWAYDPNRRLGDAGLRELLEEVKAIAGFKGRENIKPHSLRHAAATRLLRNGADLRSIQSFLGHRNLATTSIYLHTDEVQLRAIANLGALRLVDQPVKIDVPAKRFQRRRLGV